jgi:hypothetical protein
MRDRELPSRRYWLGSGTAAFMILVGFAGCGGGASGPSEQDVAPPPQNFSENALSAAQPGELATYFKSRLQQRANQGITGGDSISLGLAPAASPSIAAGAVFSSAPQQEQGVNEDDLLKSDGTTVYALHPAYTAAPEPSPARLTAVRRQADGSLSRSTATLNPDFTPQGMYLAAPASRLAVLGQKQAYATFPGGAAFTVAPPVASEQRLSLDIFGLADAARPSQTSRIEIDGYLVGSRMIGNVLYVVSNWTPDVTHYRVPANATPAQAEESLGKLSAAELLPKVRVDGQPAQPLVTEADCFLQPANASLGLQLTTITAFDLSSAGLQRSSRCFVGGAEALYVSPTNVYLASSRHYWVSGDAALTIFPRNVRTDIHKFSLQGLQVAYRASGDVPGHLGWDQEKKPYRLSEYQGDLRVISFTGETGWFGGPVTPFATVSQKAASPATLTVLRENAAERSLKPVATLPSEKRPTALGHQGEQVYAVHFAGPQAYLVTFRRTDPMYVLDLSDPAEPRTVAELAMPGYSDYLFPLPSGKLLGVGRDATADGRVQGLKLALLDVANPAVPRVLASRTLGDSGSSSALDYTRHGISLVAQGSQVQVALPVRVAETSNGKTSMVQGLARYLADTAAGTLAESPLAVAVRFDGSSGDSARYARYDLGKERSFLTVAGAYYLSGGDVSFVPSATGL